jgi:hypothetical protein
MLSKQGGTAETPFVPELARGFSINYFVDEKETVRNRIPKGGSFG